MRRATSPYTATMALRAEQPPVAPRVRVELRSSTCAATRNAGPL